MSTSRRVRDFLGRLDETAKRDTSVVPIEGTDMSLFWSQIPAFWESTYGTPWYGTASLSERVWVANRCIQLNSQQIASMPLTFNPGSPLDDAGAIRDTRPPAWASNPDPNWYPNGISDAVFSIVRQLYGYGFACLYVTAFYATGFPQFWTVLDSSRLDIQEEDGRRTYRFGEVDLNPDRIVQIDRNPSSAVHGTSALRAYGTQANAALAAASQSASVSAGGMPSFYLKSQDRKLDREQAETISTRFAERTAARGGLPPVFGPDLDPMALSINPTDLALLETQEFNARVIASAFGVPAILLNIPMTGGLNYQNPALLGEQWWRFELRPTSKRIADALSAQMLPRGQWVNFEAEDTILPLTSDSDVDDPQLSNVSDASPAQTSPATVTAIGGSVS
jgi:HK97 family phage portal protein